MTLGVTSLLLAVSARPAAALSIVPRFDSVPPPAAELFLAAVGYWETTIADPFTLELKIRTTALPGGALARTFDFVAGADGRPASASIDLDDRVGDFGWYVDPSPEDTAEFSAGSGPFHFRADLATPLAFLYDMYSVINHEIAHALGFTINYPAFAAHVSTGADGRRWYAHGAVTAPLSETGTHLSDGHYPFDLMGATMGVGERRLPSYIDLLVLSDAFGYDAALPPPPSGVPEPSTTLLLLGAVAWRAARGARRRARR